MSNTLACRTWETSRGAAAPPRVNCRSQWPLEIGSCYKNTSKLEGTQARNREFCESFGRLECSFEETSQQLRSPRLRWRNEPSVAPPCVFFRLCGSASHPGAKACASQLLITAGGGQLLVHGLLQHKQATPSLWLKPKFATFPAFFCRRCISANETAAVNMDWAVCLHYHHKTDDQGYNTWVAKLMYLRIALLQ